MVGWLLPRGPTKSQTQTSPEGEAATMLRIPSRTGSDNAVNPLANRVASVGSRGAASTDGQHGSAVGTAVVERDLITGSGPPVLPLTFVNASIIID